MNDREEETTWAELLGQGSAHLQHGIDRMIDWGFKQMKRAGSKKEEIITEEEHPAMRRVRRAGKGVMRFFGTFGDAYYKRYEKLKADRSMEGKNTGMARGEEKQS